MMKDPAIADLDCKIKIHLGTIKRKEEELAAELKPVRDQIFQLRIEKLWKETGFHLGDIIQVHRYGGFKAKITSVECKDNDHEYYGACWRYAKIKKDGGVSKHEFILFLSDTATLIEKCVVGA